MKKLIRSCRHPHVQWYAVAICLLAFTLIQLTMAVRIGN